MQAARGVRSGDVKVSACTLSTDTTDAENRDGHHFQQLTLTLNTTNGGLSESPSDNTGCSPKSQSQGQQYSTIAHLHSGAVLGNIFSCFNTQESRLSMNRSFRIPRMAIRRAEALSPS
ncbi:hypothetical protein BaRGS_00011551 [Batillaria attramentaria]|uniref:Uncharacterized protein n=1 Tax=Batillaria attramentaria TaxID=370345 RepID=A0ABD0LD87_9CAEN